MVDPVVAEGLVMQIVKERGPISAKRIVARTRLEKSIVNSILYKNRHYNKIEQSPASTWNTKPVWTWSDVKVPLPEKIRVMRAPRVVDGDDE